MKLKYKKMILLTTMSTMGIGLLTLSLSHNPNNPRAEVNSDSTREAGVLMDSSDNNFAVQMEHETEDSVTVTPTLSPTPSPTPTPVPVHELEEDGYPMIDELFKDYYAAKNLPDMNKIKSLLSDPTRAYSQEELIERTGFVDDYRNINCYTKKGPEEGTYIVYVYHEIKITGINTPAPGLAKSYLITDKDGKLKIFSGEMDPELDAYYSARNNDKDVKELINMTNQAFEEAKAKDEDLYNFWDAIDEEESSEENVEEDIQEQ